MTHMMKLAHFAYSDIKNTWSIGSLMSPTPKISTVWIYLSQPTSKRREDIGKLVSPLMLVMNIDYVPLCEEYHICIE